MLLETYAHLIDEYAERSDRIDAEAEILDARSNWCASEPS